MRFDAYGVPRGQNREKLVEEASTDEVMITTTVHSQTERLRASEPAEAMELSSAPFMESRV